MRTLQLGFGSVADPDPALFDPKDQGSGIIFSQISDPDPGSYCIKLK
jgi:hypothetical protein